ncbi:sensor histidine kinase [Fulvivirga aurantia]|uniref:sensor histidine kinase n=1 Tax=Fulvivirga aurantia TaxID=2529383 RepID=UPI001629266C|nr:histidine kinase [Fulvivirga aurantia]
MLSVIYLIILSGLTTVSFSFIYPNYDLGLTFKLMIGFTFRVNLFLHCINAIVFFLSQYKKAQLESEQLKKMHAEAKFQALRNQINPHFLFNSFNVLATLVHKDPNTSSKFIEQLSDVYRYLLYNQENQLVTIKEEIEFLKSYIYLLKIRFGENLKVILDLNDTLDDKYIVPASLQMLIENAIKHNVVSKKDPLCIKIYNNDNYLVVENSKNLKKVKEPSSRLGLKNIKDRYKFLSEHHALIIKSNGSFKVKIPILDAA